MARTISGQTMEGPENLVERRLGQPRTSIEDVDANHLVLPTDLDLDFAGVTHGVVHDIGQGSLERMGPPGNQTAPPKSQRNLDVSVRVIIDHHLYERGQIDQGGGFVVREFIAN